MDFKIYVKGVEKHEHTISYQRSQNICSGVGTLDIELDPDIDLFLTVNPYDSVILYENDIKKGTYYILEYTKDANTGVYSVKCQDRSKRLQDYFISTQYTVKSRITTRYWIQKFLDEAGIDYEFDLVDESDYGAYVNNDTVFGPASAFDLITQLLQMSSWYIYFDAEGTAIIGKFIKDTDNIDLNVDDSSIINLRTTKNDKMLRNRVVVWGKADPYNRGWVFADVYKPSPWDYDSNDKRTLVISNGYIENVTAAYSLAGKAIKEFSKITYEKEITVADAQDVELGNIVYVNSKYFTGAGLLTTIASSVSKDGGLQTVLTLDQRCPRIYAYYSFGNPVYIGTTEDGVWKKPLQFHTWSDYNTGLPIDDRHIVDLAANAGTLVCVTSKGNAYIRTPLTTGWNKISLSDYECYGGGYSYRADELTAVCCDINKSTCEVYVGYKGQPDSTNYPDRWQSFIITATSSTKYKISFIRDSMNNIYYQVYDLTSNEKELIISAHGELTSKALIFSCRTTESSYPYIGNTFIHSDYTNSMPEQTTLILDHVTSLSQYGSNIPSDGEYVYYYFLAGGRYYVVRRKLSDASYVSIDVTDTLTPTSGSPILDDDARLLLFGVIAPGTPIYYGFAIVDFDAQTVTLVGADYPLTDIFSGYTDPNQWFVFGSKVLNVIQIRENEFVAFMTNTYVVMGFFINIETTAISFHPIIVLDAFTPQSGPNNGYVNWNLPVNPTVDRNKLIVSFARSAYIIGGG